MDKRKRRKKERKNRRQGKISVRDKGWKEAVGETGERQRKNSWTQGTEE